jgi:hypothetical protein
MLKSLLNFVASGAPVVDNSPRTLTRNFVNSFGKSMRNKQTQIGRESTKAPSRMYRKPADLIKEHGQEKHMRKSH